MEETWVSVKDFPDYEVSNTGKCRNVNGNEIKAHPHWKGYFKFALFRDKVQHRFFAHRLVALHFIGNDEGLPHVNHIDGNPANNHVENLEWVSASDNIRHLFKTGRKSHRGSKNTAAILNEEKVAVIKSKLRDDGRKANMEKLADDFGVSFRTIEHIKYKKHWTHVN